MVFTRKLHKFTTKIYKMNVDKIEKYFESYEKRNIDFKNEIYCFQFAGITQDAYVAGYKKLRSEIIKKIHNLKEDLLTTKNKKEILFTIKILENISDFNSTKFNSNKKHIKNAKNN